MTVLAFILPIAGFFLGVWAYRLGLKDQLAMSQSKPLESIIPHPIEYIENRKEVKKIKEENETVLQGINNIFSYDGNPQSKGE